ncbi:recombinase family protein [Citrobacter freundii]|uniref:recombinase family protein n=1 Tax=Citrobacter TaxID=544 RepID=UPI0005CD7014|nr:MULTISPECIES: recombinase family protein [Citrobacter]AUV44022.1 recombinase family protein [Citrobacter freundii complex sp. CFNIH9]KJC09122.1 DNA-invertase [Citrobacter freundii]MDH0768504.1 recombinase family protein [Citrobacter freundii]MDH1002779.1 recombinase family protein [Citrobacter freundii]MDH1808094.1 recombinase family protein [Citrobacter freundii]
MLIGYVRVSTNDQNLELQLDALNRLDCDQIFEDKISGAKSKRPGLDKMMKKLRPGDTVVVWKLDRLGRSLIHLVDLLRYFRENNIEFISVTEGIRISTSIGRFAYTMLSAAAEMERENIIERTRAGLAVARAKGRIGGRRPKLTPEQWAQAGRLLAAGETRQRVAIIYDVGISTLYKKFPAADI